MAPANTIIEYGIFGEVSQILTNQKQEFNVLNTLRHTTVRQLRSDSMVNFSAEIIKLISNKSLS